MRLPIPILPGGNAKMMSFLSRRNRDIKEILFNIVHIIKTHSVVDMEHLKEKPDI